MTDNPGLMLIDNCRKKWWRLASVQISALAAAMSAYLWASPDTVIAVLTQVPGPVRVGIVLFFFLVRLLARLVRQPKVIEDAAQSN